MPDRADGRAAIIAPTSSRRLERKQGYLSYGYDRPPVVLAAMCCAATRLELSSTITGQPLAFGGIPDKVRVMVMHPSVQIASQLLSSPGGRTMRARVDADAMDYPRLTSGFGAVREQEEDAQSSTKGYLGFDRGPNSAAIDRVLLHHGTRLGANVGLLEQRYRMLPHPDRFQSLDKTHPRLSTPSRTATATAGGLLPHLVGLHLNLLRKIEALVDQHSDGPRGEVLLAQIARSHEEMAWVLLALLKEGESVRDSVPFPVIAGAPQLAPSEARWENEGGAAASEPGAS